MSSGSYFTIYRKNRNRKASADELEALKAEYRKSDNKIFGEKKQDGEDSIPLLMHEGFTCADFSEDTNSSNVYYDLNGIAYEKLLEFHFCSTFTCLKEQLDLNPYKNSQRSTFISRDDAKRMLQAIEYVLGEEYSKKFENVLHNEYVELFGNGYSKFDDRLNSQVRRVYIDKDEDGYTVAFGDSQWNAEIAECDNEIKFNLMRAKSCLQAFLEAERYTYAGFDLVLEYSAY